MQETWVQSLSQEDSLEGHGTPLQYSCLGNPIDGGACRLQSMGSQKSWTWLKNSTTTNSIFLTTGMEEPGGLQSMGQKRGTRLSDYHTHTHCVVEQVSRTNSSDTTETLCLLNSYTPAPPAFSPWQPPLYSLLMGLAVLDLSCKGNHAVLLWLFILLSITSSVSSMLSNVARLPYFKG